MRKYLREADFAYGELSLGLATSHLSEEDKTEKTKQAQGIDERRGNFFY